MSRPLVIVLLILAGGLGLLLWNDAAGSTFGLDNDRFGRLIYLSAIVAMLASAVVVSRRRLPGMLGMLAVWAVIVLALAVGYQYRYELQDVASRATAGLIPGSPMSLTFDDGATGVRVDRSGSGHFEVNGSVNGASISFLVDTGATSTVLTTRDAVAAGYPAEALSFEIPVFTANGQALAARVTAEVIAVGSIERRRVPVLVAEDGRLGQSLLGMNFIGTLSGFDMRGDRLILRD